MNIREIREEMFYAKKYKKTTKPRYASISEERHKPEERHLYRYIKGVYHHSFNGGKDWIKCTCADGSSRECLLEIEFNKL